MAWSGTVGSAATLADSGISVCQDELVDKRVERGRTTRRQLISTATDLFSKVGYDATSIEAVLDASHASRGSLYHHFANKEALFEAVLEDVEAKVAQRLRDASSSASSAKEAIVAGCQAFLRLARDPTVRQIVLIDAPAVVGWRRWREIDERHAFGLLKAGVAAAASESGLSDEMVDPLAHIILASLLESALLVAGSNRPRESVGRAEEAMALTVSRLFA